MADLPVPQTSAEEVRRVTEEVLARPEFAPAEPAWWERILDAVSDFVAEVLAAVAAGGRGSIIGTLVLVAVVVVLGLVVLRFARTVRADPAVPVAVDTQIGRNARDWLDEAEQHEQSGRWRAAVRCRYRAVLADLASAGLVEEVAGRTSGEYRSAVAVELPSASASFATATDIFDTAWYGHTPVTADDVAAFSEVARSTLDDAGLRRAVAAAHE
ncbi:MAG: DUF4129 domain-containing protein [Nitriliruptorales bacterium]|nr:DUF4129 domain-containing protein [Nitriliruptorales bacterium]